MVIIQNHQIAKLWIAPDGDAQRAKEIMSNVGVAYGLEWSPNGSIIFSAMAGNNLHVSSINPDGSNKAQLTANGGDNYSPAVSPDGRFIAFASNRNATLNIWLMNASDGSDARQLTFSDGNSYPAFSPHSQWVVYDNQSEGATTIWKVSVEGGE